MKLLFVIDMQNDFIDGVLGSPEAQAIVPKVAEKIKNANNVIFTSDTHGKSYFKTEEGKHLPIAHCIKGSKGILINSTVFNAAKNGEKNIFIFQKETFGYPWNLERDFFGDALPLFKNNLEEIDLNKIEEIEIVGLDTDFCVLANAMTLKAAFPNVPITIDASCCAGSTPEWDEKALDILEHCHFNVINR